MIRANYIMGRRLKVVRTNGLEWVEQRIGMHAVVWYGGPYSSGPLSEVELDSAIAGGGARAWRSTSPGERST